ncbi:hypothetical protein FS842_005675 [Serendipita sp. 407]|nr:hypothetical protein FS842_005675 [Serendipita sp. 407]
MSVDQSLTDCFHNCSSISLSVGCSDLGDLSCICTNLSFTNVLLTCVHQQCPDEEQSSSQYLEELCVSYSSTSSLPSSATSNPSSSTSSSAPSSQFSTARPLISTSAQIAIIIGCVIGVIVVASLAIYAYWWFREGRHPDTSFISKSKDGTRSVVDSEQARTYRGEEAIATPWMMYDGSGAAGSSQRLPQGYNLDAYPMPRPAYMSDMTTNYPRPSSLKQRTTLYNQPSLHSRPSLREPLPVYERTDTSLQGEWGQERTHQMTSSGPHIRIHPPNL